MRAVEHVQLGGPLVEDELPLHRAAVVILVARQGDPDADVFAAAADAGPAPSVFVAEVGAVTVFVLVTALVEAAGPERHLGRRPGHGDGGGVRGRHRERLHRVHVDPVERGADIDVGAPLGHGGGGRGVAAEMRGGGVETLRAAEQRVMDIGVRPADRGAAVPRRVDGDLGVVAAVGGGVGDDAKRAARPLLSGRGRPAPIHLPAIVAAAEEIGCRGGAGVIVGVVDGGQGGRGSAAGDRDNAVAQRERGADDREGDVAARAGAAAGDVGARGRKNQKCGAKRQRKPTQPPQGGAGRA